MKVELRKYPTEEDWMLVKECALVTIGKTPLTPPDTQWKHNMLEARHSPIRELKFVFRAEVPYWVSVHLCRHIHARPYVKSQRNDRQVEYDRTKAPQDAPVVMMWSMEAEELMIVANKRLCCKASPETRHVFAIMCHLVEEKCPEFKGLLVPMCEYHGGVCHEIKSCGRAKHA